MVSIPFWVRHQNYISLENYYKFMTLQLSDLFSNSNLSTIIDGLRTLTLNNWYSKFLNSMTNHLLSKILIYFGFCLERNRQYSLSAAHLSDQNKENLAQLLCFYYHFGQHYRTDSQSPMIAEVSVYSLDAYPSMHGHPCYTSEVQILYMEDNRCR